MAGFDRTGIINIIDWIEEDAKQEIHKEKNAEHLRIKTQYEKVRWFALSEMYRTIEEAQDKHEDYITAIKITELCYGMGFVSEKVCSEICDYLQKKAKRLDEK